MQGRYGLTDTVDLGLRLYTMGAATELRWQMYDAPPDDFPRLAALISLSSGVHLASRFGCTSTCISSSDEAIGFMAVRIPIGIRVDRFELTLAPNARVELPALGAWLWLGGQAALTVAVRGWDFGVEGGYVRPFPFFQTASFFERAVVSPEGHLGAIAFKRF